MSTANSLQRLYLFLKSVFVSVFISVFLKVVDLCQQPTVCQNCACTGGVRALIEDEVSFDGNCDFEDENG